MTGPLRVHLPPPGLDVTLRQVIAVALTGLMDAATTADVTLAGDPRVEVVITDGVPSLVVEAPVKSPTRRKRRVPPHGTDAHYYRHTRITKDEPCGPCRDAHAEAERARKAGQRVAS